MYIQACGLVFLVLASAAFGQKSWADGIQLPEASAQFLGAYADYLIEDAQPLKLEQAVEQYLADRFQRGRQPVQNFGIGSHPVWLHLELNNPDTSFFLQNLIVGVTWLDRLDIYVMQGGQLQSHVHTGDEVPFAPGLTPALGYVLPLHFAPGRSDIYLRVESIDPMPLPIELMSGDQLKTRQLYWGYYYGFFYGFLAALCAYNLLLFAGLRERSYLYYSLVLMSAIFCSLTYTGHGVAWLWPDLPWLQRYVILVSMVVYSVFGLLFASRFLSLDKNSPRVLSAMRWFAGLGLGAMVLSLLMGNQLVAALVAFVFIALFTVGMFLLGILALHRGWTHGRYFLVATFFAMLGVASTDLSVWGEIPFTVPAYHGMELGLILEATLLALALAYRMRQYQQANQLEKQIARQDHLTGLNNRRSFIELASPFWSAAERGERPLSLVMMDIDHFKQVNDQYGHKTGDDVLVVVANLLREYGRPSDIVARWGGEEFVILLAETDISQAAGYAERLRQAISEMQVLSGKQLISLTASFGVVRRSPKSTLDDIVQLVDIQLYKAKNEGRNRVCCGVL